MKTRPGIRLPTPGFTLIELLAALLILSAMALMSYRGLGAVLDAREHVARETDKWRRVSTFISRFERDIGLAAPRPVRSSSGTLPAWRGTPGTTGQPLLEFSRFASAEATDLPRRVAYGFNAGRRVELWLWPGLDMAAGTQPERYPLLEDVSAFELQYLNARLAWVDSWPGAAGDPPLPQAVRLRIVLGSGEEIVRIFGLRT